MKRSKQGIIEDIIANLPYLDISTLEVFWQEIESELGDETK